jgi:hypothetical protein
MNGVPAAERNGLHRLEAMTAAFSKDHAPVASVLRAAKLRSLRLAFSLLAPNLRIAQWAAAQGLAPLGGDAG